MLDSHCHLNDDSLYPSSGELIKEAKENGVTTLLVVGWDINSSKRAIEIASKYEGVYAAIGIHPENLDSVNETTLNDLEELSKNPKVVAIGEIGLDYHWFKDPKDRENQKVWFIKQIELANKLNLPISIHARDASEDTYLILKEHKPNRGGVLHCYSGSTEMMDKFIKLGLYFGFDGPITYKNAIEPKECVKKCPLDRLLTETDSPYLTPTPNRGKPNKPTYIRDIVKAISELKNLSIDEIGVSVDHNFRKLFHGELYD